MAKKLAYPYIYFFKAALSRTLKVVSGTAFCQKAAFLVCHTERWHRAVCIRLARVSAGCDAAFSLQLSQDKLELAHTSKSAAQAKRNSNLLSSTLIALTWGLHNFEQHCSFQAGIQM